MPLTWLGLHPVVMFLPFVVAMLPVVLALYMAATMELALRVGRHRGVYKFADFEERAGSREAGELAGMGVDGLMETFVWEGQIRFPPPPDPELGVAYITITPDIGQLTLPALMEPRRPWIGDVEIVDPADGETSYTLVNAETSEYRLTLAIGSGEPEPGMSAEALVYQHERVYHPLVAA